MKTRLLFFFLLISCIASAQKFNDYFTDKTLRLDYIFAGNANQQNIYLSEMIQLSKWHGRVENLSVTPIQGNGQIKVYSTANDKLIYVLRLEVYFRNG